MLNGYVVFGSVCMYNEEEPKPIDPSKPLTPRLVSSRFGIIHMGRRVSRMALASKKRHGNAWYILKQT